MEDPLGINSRAHAWLAGAVARTDKLPPAIMRVLASLGRGDNAFDEVQAALADSEGLRASVLKVANGALYSPLSPVVDVAHAAVLLGHRQLLGLTLIHAVHNIIRTGASCHGHSHNGLLSHSLATGTTAWAVANDCGLPDSVGGAAYVAGLFHDIGKALLSLRWPNFDMTTIPEDAPGLAGLERAELGIDHVEASVLLARHWQLEPDIIDIICDHHAPGSSLDARVVLHLADYLTSAYGFGFQDGLPPETPLDPACLGLFEDHPEFLITGEQHALAETAHAAMTIDLML